MQFYYYTKRFRRSYADAPLRVQKQCDRQLGLLAQDLRHPSLRAKKCDESPHVAFRDGIFGGQDFSPDVQCCATVGFTAAEKLKTLSF
jgi:hypothetical protein